MKIRRIILDMDGVLTDFVGAACKAWGVTVDQITPHWPIGEGWDMAPHIGKALGNHIDDFWRPIDKDKTFWSDMDETKWHDDILQVVRKVTDDWHIVTTPSTCITSHAGKLTWLKTQYGAGFDRFAITPHKEIFAQPGVVLIDDNEDNVAKFIKAGGSAVLFPADSNRLFEYRFDPVCYVYDQLKDIG